MEPTGKQFRKRSAILTCLQSSRAHPSAEAVFEQLKSEYTDLSLGTVYRNLSLFKRQGLISSLGTVNGVERFDGNTMPHVHFICTGCDAVVDLPQLDTPEGLCQEAAADVGGRVDGCQLIFSGLCRSCLHEKGGEAQ